MPRESVISGWSKPAAAETWIPNGRNNDPVPVGRQRFPQQFFVVVGVRRSVHFRRIKECISYIHGPGKEFRHFLLSAGAPQAWLIPMQPRPMAETFRLLLPSSLHVMFCPLIVFMPAKLP